MPEKKRFFIMDLKKKSAKKNLQEGSRRTHFWKCSMQYQYKKEMFCS